MYICDIPRENTPKWRKIRIVFYLFIFFLQNGVNWYYYLILQFMKNQKKND